MTALQIPPLFHVPRARGVGGSRRRQGRPACEMDRRARAGRRGRSMPWRQQAHRVACMSGLPGLSALDASRAVRDRWALTVRRRAWSFQKLIP